MAPRLPERGATARETGDRALFSVVTPSYNMLPYLTRCARSIADQGEAVEHLVMDGGSRDGTAEWLAARNDIHSVVERDRGMYDAINKGLTRARGEYVSYLNCDEQYLPGTLGAVRAYFAAHPSVDIVFGGALLVDPEGALISYRKAYPPRWSYIATSHLYVLSCTMFFRRRILDDGLLFDVSWRNVGDADFVLRALSSGYRAGYLSRYLAVFTMTGSNLSTTPAAAMETAELRRRLPRWSRSLSPALNAARLIEKGLTGAYRQRFPLEYAVYTDSPERRDFRAEQASWRWPA